MDIAIAPPQEDAVALREALKELVNAAAWIADHEFLHADVYYSAKTVLRNLLDSVPNPQYAVQVFVGFGERPDIANSMKAEALRVFLIAAYREWGVEPPNLW